MQSTMFDMSAVINKLRTIAEGPEDQQSVHHDPGMETGGHEIDNSSFTRTMQRLGSIKGAVSDEHYSDLRAGIRALYMNRRPNLQQMSALMDLLEAILSYVAQDDALFQRLKSDLAKGDKGAEVKTNPVTGEPEQNQAPEVGAPKTATPTTPTMRDLKA